MLVLVLVLVPVLLLVLVLVHKLQQTIWKYLWSRCFYSGEALLYLTCSKPFLQLQWLVQQHV